jgi:hypothetical protein
MATQKILDSVSSQASIPGPWCDESPESVLSELRDRPKPILLGLPCARCRAYYDAKLATCPCCGCDERVLPKNAAVLIGPKSRAA